MSSEQRPDLEEILRPLKAFQRRTVEYVFDRLYTAPDTTNRFLVADEVGLGKTMVARGVIAKAIDHLWDGVGRIDIVYICSNAAIARQNIRKLRVGPEKELSLATRLTMLPAQLKDLKSRKLNFVSFTPGTSFDLRSRAGAKHERVVLYWLLKQTWDGGAGLCNLLQAGVQRRDYWKAAIARSNMPELEPSLVEDFAEELSQPANRELRQRFEELCSAFGRFRSWSYAERWDRNELIGELRMLLARTCVRALEPDLVILDEFQRFKHLLSAEDEMSRLAQCLFDYRAPEGHMCPVLLLSATPYRMYSTDGEVGENDHYPDFIETTRFLMKDQDRVARFEQHLRDFRRGLHRGIHGDTAGIEQIRDAVQSELRRVMVRNERVVATEDRQAMVGEPACPAPLVPEDIRQYAATDAIAACLDERDPIEYWKSAPYLLNFMRGYKLKESFNKSMRRAEVEQTLMKHRGALLNRRTILRYSELDPANARLRVLADQLLGDDQWQLLWAPPSMPYWPFGPSFDRAAAGFTKALVFSAWNVVPDVVSAVLSYEAERRMLAGSRHSYHGLHKERRGLLRFSVSEGRLTGMTALTLLFPSLALADEISPLEHALDDPTRVRDAVRRQIWDLVGRLPGGSGETDDRWYWAAPVLLDKDKYDVQGFLRQWKLERPVSPDQQLAEDAEEGEDTLFNAHVERLAEVFGSGEPLGGKPVDLVEVLTDMALGAPGVLAARSLRCLGVDDLVRRRAASRVAEGFRSLYNQPTAMALLRRRYQDAPFWRAALRYGIDGNLQALLDEYLHQLWEQGGWQDEERDEAALNVANDIAYATTIKTSRVSADVYRFRQGAIRSDRLNIRTSFALRYGRLVGDEAAQGARENAVRVAFNSPFHPFVLITTSIGQEGLDFHPWCHAVYHWNLPGNPVDLEQREGRVHRYKGHAVRKNVADRLGLGALRGRWSPGDDPWQRLFEAAAELRGSDDTELVPYWIFDGPHRVERRVPMLPYSREVERLQRLKRDLVAYRLVFGQPRQQELLEAIQASELSGEEMDRWVVNLRV